MTDSIVFDRAASFYDETRGFPPGVAGPAAALIAEVGGLTSDDHVLEVGVGTGRIALPLSAHTRTLTGIDLSRGMLTQLAHKRADEPVYPVEGDATHLPFADATFNGVLAVHIFHLIPAWRAMLVEMRRVLKPGAPLIHAYGGTKNSGHWQELRKLRRSIRERFAEAEHPGVPFSERDTFLQAEGWEPVGEKQTITYEASVRPRELIEGLENRVWSHTWRMPDEAIEQMLVVTREYLHDTYDDLDQVITSEGEFGAQAFLPPS